MRASRSRKMPAISATPSNAKQCQEVAAYSKPSEDAEDPDAEDAEDGMAR